MILSAIGARNCLVICCVVTEDAQSRMRGYGPFQEGPEPTAQITNPTAVASTSSAPPAQHGPGPAPTNGSPVAPPHDSAQPVSPNPGEIPYLPSPTSAQPGSGGVYPADRAGAIPISGGPYAGDPATAQPTSGPGYPSGPVLAGPSPAGYPSGPALAGPSPAGYPSGPSPTSGPGYPSGPTPTGPSPTSSPGHPVDSTGLPTSGTPYDFTPAAPSPRTDRNAAPTSGTPAPTSGGPPDPYDFSFSGRRIEPSPPPERNRLIIGLAVGLVAGLLLFGTAGYFVGNSARPGPAAAPTTAAPTPSGSLGIFEQNQLARNQPHFTTAGLTPLAQGWLPHLSGCERNGEAGGPVLNPGEKARVRCTLNSMSVVFVEYASIAGRDKARVKTLGQNVDARSLTPGVGAATQRPTPSARTTGNYVEYAYKLTERRVARTVAGIWWDDAQTPVAAYLLAYWKDGAGESWEPMRDLWSRYA
jgi:hypothetical protein